jgi:tetratricopeptide (TPR) repeat protein
MPDAAHVVHMPAHIDVRMGRYADAARANERAIAVDGSYLGKASPNVAFYKMIYAPHNLDFLATAAGMEGRSAATLLAARALERHLDPEMLRAMPGFDFLLGRAAWTLLRFGRYGEALAEPLPPADFPFALAAAHAARGLALLRLDRADEAAAEAMAMRAAAAAIPEGAAEGLNSAAALVRIPVALLEGELAIARGEVDEGVARLAAAAAAEDELRYNEPSDWHFPARHLIGATLLRLGRDGEAEAVFRADLARHRGNGWALAGLIAALERQGKASEAEALRGELERAWTAADLGLERLVAPPAPAG